MSDSHAEKVQQVFLSALEVPAEKRDAWLRNECGTNESLWAEVRSLLEHANPSVDLLEQNLDEVISDIPQLGDLPEEKQTPQDELPANVNCDHFLSKLSEVGVLSPDEFASVSDSVSSAHPSTDARQLASQLVTKGKLTSYQAAALLKGEPDLLIDKYLILDLIDVGGMGMVFKAIHRTMNRLVALKMISQQMLASDDQIRRFKREVRVAATLEHLNIVRAYDADESRGVNFLVMEYVRGDNLSRIVRASGPLSLSQAVDCIRQAATGLQHAHERGIVHRDIKPGNLLLDDQGTVKLLDLGLAHIDDSIRLDSPENGSTDADSGRPYVSCSELTAAGAILGTASFMAPEQSLDAHLIDFRSDIYSLGCTLYFLLTGEVPYSGSTIFKVFVQHRKAEIPSLQNQRPDVPDSVTAVYQKMVAKKPEDRFQSVSELIVALNDCHIPNPVKETPRAKSKTAVTSNATAATISEPGTTRDSLFAIGKFRKTLIGVACLVVLAGIIAYSWPDSSLHTDNPVPSVDLPDTDQPADTFADSTTDLPVLSAGDHLPQNISVAPETSAADLLATGNWEWKVTQNLGPKINSREFELGADMTADGLTLIYASVRNSSPPGNRDLWISTRETQEAPWSAPLRLPPEINTDGNEEEPQISADGLSLSFRRNARWFLSTRGNLNAPWQKAIPDPIAVGKRRDYRLTPDGLSAFRPRVMIPQKVRAPADGGLMVWRRSSIEDSFDDRAMSDELLPSVTRFGNMGSMSNDGRLFIYNQNRDPEKEKSGSMLVMSTRPDWNHPWSKPIPLFPDDSLWAASPRLLRDGKSILFISKRPGGYGANDIWMAELVKKSDAHQSESTSQSTTSSVLEVSE
ncbi:serine/threonine protein kinase [Gimesia maris]|uniref:serine/threonine protein kinase n=1 Tax=Gimesia maris TaxID=122 RepID=UPI0030DCB008|tara:strand:+ start:39125 stop:41698 length:2574 start_codon:yes stop_codon:yes gene_type:complete